ncbi:hypothetical protein HK105_200022 [Polyrhizophydium stewartii]|uniref:TBC1 domain family member 31 n=1 Tax=Polyrhizophydium stewartii TaxID=2732419 RepID=A0ABR4NKA3_9FUNG
MRTGDTLTDAGAVASASAASRTLLLGDSRSGQIWRPLEWKKVMAGYTRRGTLLRICNSSKGTGTESRGVPAPLRSVPFACVAFSREMAAIPPEPEPQQSHADPPAFYSYVLCASDQRGHIFAADFVQNRFWVVARTGVAATAICFNAVRRREVIVALADRSIQCYNIDNCQLIAKLPPMHMATPHHISVHPTRPLAITTSNTEAILWDTEDWERKRVMTSPTARVQQASFSHDGVSIIAAFEDGSIFFWTIDTFSLQWKITLDQMSDAASDAETNVAQLLASNRLSYFALSQNGELFVYGGISSTVYVWNMVERRLLHEILIPAFREMIIVQIAFVGSSSILAVLANSGHLIFIDAAEARYVGQLQGMHLFHSFSISPEGSVLASVLLDAKHITSLVRLDPIMRPSAPMQERDITEPETAPRDQAANLTTHQFQRASRRDKRVTVTAEQPKTFYELIESKQETSLLNRQKLARFLSHYGEYSPQYRTLVWRFLLKLPENRAGYEALLDQGVHPVFKDFRKRFPLRSDRAAKSMERVLSCLAFWSPIFENLEYLPSMVFPFVMLFSNDMFSGFEVAMTVIINWCQKWWDYYPNPPIDCLDMTEDMIAYHDPELLAHFVKYKVTSQVYAWSMMKTLFTEQFSRPDWLRLWDHLLTQPPSFMYHFVVAYILAFRAALLETTKLSDFKYFFCRRNASNLTRILKEAYRLQSVTPTSLAPSTFLAPFTPCLRGEYPIFNKYPEFIVNYQSQMRDKIRSDEAEYVRKRRVADEMARLTEELRRDKKAWESADWKMDQMIERWWEQMMGEEDLREQSKSKMDALEKEKRISAMQQISDARRAFVDQQANTTEQHISNISRAVGRNRRTRDQAQNHEELERAFQAIETEWLQRRDEMVRMRNELSSLQQSHAQKLVDHSLDMGQAAGEAQ